MTRTRISCERTRAVSTPHVHFDTVLFCSVGSHTRPMGHKLRTNCTGSKGSTKLFGSVVGCGMPAILAIFVLMKSGTYFAKAQAEKSQKSNGVATEFLTSIKTLLSFNLEGYAERKYETTNTPAL